MTVNTRVLQLFMAARPDEHFIQIHRTLRLQVVPDIAALPHCQRHQSAAFISDTATLLVWEDEPTRLLERAEYIQDALMKMSWKSEPVEGEEEKGDGKKPFVQIEEYDEVTEEEAGMEEKPRETVLWQCIYEGATNICHRYRLEVDCDRTCPRPTMDPPTLHPLYTATDLARSGRSSHQ